MKHQVQLSVVLTAKVEFAVEADSYEEAERKAEELWDEEKMPEWVWPELLRKAEPQNHEIVALRDWP